MNAGHCTTEELNLLVDGRVDAEDTVTMQVHLRACAECRAALQSLARINTAMKHAPVQRLSRDFTRNVLEALNITSGTPFLYRIVENLPYVFAFMVVSSVMLTIYIATGALSTDQGTLAQPSASQVGTVVGEKLTALVSVVNSLLRHYCSFLYGGTTAKAMLTLLVAVGGLILIDRILKRKISVGR